MNSSKINEKYKLNFNYRKLFESLSFHDMRLVLIFKSKVNEEQLSLITSNLAQIYKDGIPITTALELVADILPNKTYKNSLSKVLVLIKEEKVYQKDLHNLKTCILNFL
jgi:type IV pilus assembly protein PilC